ncbi:MAG: hypothetical protein R6V58_11885 [Planctomycetota bacterium]
MRFVGPNKQGKDNPYRGVIIAAVALVALLLVGYGGSQLVKWSAGREKEAPGGPSPELPEYEESLPEPEPELSPQERARYSDPSSLEEVYESNIVGQNDAFFHLLYWMKTASEEELSRLAERARPAPPGEGLRADPLEPGTAVRLAGRVVTIRSRLPELSIPKANIETAQYEIRSDAGHLCSVYAVHAVAGIEEGDPVKVVGRYLRLISHGTTFSGSTGRLIRGLSFGLVGEPKEVLLPIIITRELDGSPIFEQETVLDEVADDQLGHEAQPFFYLVHRVQGLSQEEIVRRAEQNEALTLERIDRDPASARGRFVTVEGVLIATQRHRKQPNIAGVRHVYWCAIRGKGEGDRKVWVYTLDRPAEFARHDMVRAHGVFLKRRFYYDQKSREQPALLFVARGLERIEYRVKTPNIGPLVLLLGAVVLVGMVIAVLVDRRRSQAVARHAHELEARNQAGDLNETARAVAARRREEREQARKPPEPPEKRGPPLPDDG